MLNRKNSAQVSKSAAKRKQQKTHATSHQDLGLSGPDLNSDSEPTLRKKVTKQRIASTALARIKQR